MSFLNASSRFLDKLRGIDLIVFKVDETAYVQLKSWKGLTDLNIVEIMKLGHFLKGSCCRDWGKVSYDLEFEYENLRTTDYSVLIEASVPFFNRESCDYKAQFRLSIVVNEADIRVFEKSIRDLIGGYIND